MKRNVLAASLMKLAFMALLFVCSEPLSRASELRVELLPDRRITVRWTAAGEAWKLQGADALGLASGWGDVDATPVLNGGENAVTLTPSLSPRFFRLRSLSIATPTSDELIGQAVANGTITEETGLIYRVYVLFNDSRLPNAYKGNDEGVDAAGALDETLERWNTLSEATRATLEPFLIPPAYQGSWSSPVSGARQKSFSPSRPELDPHWGAYPPSGGTVKVWYDTRNTNDFALAVFCANSLNNDIWPAIIGLGIFPPLSDLGTARYDGGDGRLDVYLSDMIGPGLVVTHFGEASTVSIATKNHPVFLMVNKTKTQKEIQGTLAHEFMHACQWAYAVSAFSLSSYQWLKEATAQWAIDFVYPSNQLEHTYAKYFFATPRDSLDLWDNATNHGYGSYLFFQFLSRSLGPAMIQKCWSATMSNSDQLKAVNDSIPGGFKDQWPKFARILWNQDPVVSQPNSFVNWDQMAETPGTRAGSGDLPTGVPEHTIDLGDDQRNLSSTYYHFTFADIETRSLMFHNTFYDNFKAGEDVTVHAMWKNAAGVWTEEGWTNLQWIGFCRDQKDQRITDLVIIVSSAKWESPGEPIRAAEMPAFKRNNIGCWGFQGTASRVTRNPNDGVGETTVSASVRFGFQPSPQTSDDSEGRRRAFLIAPMYHDGGLQFNEQYTQGDCTYTASGSFSMPSYVTGGDTSSIIYLNNYPEALPDYLREEAATLIGPEQRSYTGSGVTARLITGQVSGMDCDTSYITFPGLWWLSNDTAYEDGGTIPKVNPDGRLQGTFIDSSQGTIYTWNLAPIQEP